MKYESVPVPFKTDGNRQYLTDQQLAECPTLRDFVGQFQDCFEYDWLRCVFWFYPEGNCGGEKLE